MLFFFFFFFMERLLFYTQDSINAGFIVIVQVFPDEIYILLCKKICYNIIIRDCLIETYKYVHATLLRRSVLA